MLLNTCTDFYIESLLLKQVLLLLFSVFYLCLNKLLGILAITINNFKFL